MSSLHEIALRRGALLSRIQGQREKIAGVLAPLGGTLRIADGAWAGVRWARDNPLAIAGVVAALGLLQPRRALRWLRLGIEAWQAWRLVEQALEKHAAREAA